MFYEMCFTFSTNMERIHVIQNLRQREIVLSDNIDQQLYQKQIFLIKEMLNHDPGNLKLYFKNFKINSENIQKGRTILK